MIILRQRNFSLFDNLKNYADKLNKKIDPNYKTEDERLQESRLRWKNERETKEKRREEAYRALSKTHSSLYDINKNTIPYYPDWGDGDEYPGLSLNEDINDKNYGGFSLGVQHGPDYLYHNGRWFDVTDGRRRPVNNLKQDVIKNLDNSIKEWKGINYLDKDQTDKVLRYLNSLKSEASKNL